MSYEEAFAAVPGCQVEWCEYFGSYSGRMLAKLNLNGVIVYLHDWYGSCCGCDSFRAEFSWGDEEREDYKDRLAKFGAPYVESALPLENIISALEAERDDWSGDIAEMLTKLYAERAQ